MDDAARWSRGSLAVAVAVSLLLTLALAGCAGGGGGTDRIRDPLADLDRAEWSVVDAPTLRSRPVDAGTVDRAAWSRAGVDSGRVEATREAISQFVAAAYLGAETLRATDDDGDLRSVLAHTPAVWRDAVAERWTPEQRAFTAIELAPGYRVIGSPHATGDWYLTERDGRRLVEVGGTVAYSVLDVHSGTTGVVALRYGISAEIGDAAHETPVAATNRVALGGVDTCRTVVADGLVVPALGTSDPARTAQSVTRSGLVAHPGVSRDALAAEQGGLLAGDPRAAVGCEDGGGAPATPTPGP